MHKRRIFKNKELEDRISEIVRRQEYHAYSGSLERLDPRLKGYSDLDQKVTGMTDSKAQIQML